MSLNESIRGFVVGDNLEIRRTVTNLRSPITGAWLTIKRHHGVTDGDATIAKVISTVDAPGTGQVITAGGAEVDGDLRFDLTPEDTRKLGTLGYVYDVQIECEDDAIFTLEKGTLRLTLDVTRAPEDED